MDKNQKFGILAAMKSAETADMEAINRLTLEPLEASQVYTFSVNACDNQIDRDMERFSDRTLDQLAKLFVGKPVIFDHRWSAAGQTARIYGGQVVQDGNVKRLRLDCYMLVGDQTAPIVEAIKGGIMREVSVGVACKNSTCSICGREYYTCGHLRGEEYDGKTCVSILNDAVDAYELSFVAVPAQREAGVTKAAGVTAEETDREKAEKAKKSATVRLSVEKARQAQRIRKINFDI